MSETRKEQLYRLIRADAMKKGYRPIPTFDEMENSKFFTSIHVFVEMVLAEEREHDQWISVNERLPEDNENVLVVCNGDITIAHISLGVPSDLEDPLKLHTYWENDVWGAIDLPTYWKPLPVMPSEILP